MEPRQLWATPTASAILNMPTSDCTPVTLEASGVLKLPNRAPVTLTQPLVYQPSCTASVNSPQPAIIANGGLNIDQTASSSDTTITDLNDPFYASTFPQCYALAATTMTAYVLVIMLVIAPRSFYDGGIVVLGRKRRHGFTTGATQGVSIGGRPWLQKVAALTVAISLTIATADTFRVAEEQYRWGIQNAQALQEAVLGGTQLKVIRLISDTFLWLAQAQTLIRLFPRQREKIIIKYTAFALITLDIVFGALNAFQYTSPGNTRPRSFTDAVPALSYLFQLSLGLLYAAWVIYYSLMKKRYAFYHPLMKNICLMAILSILSLLVPVVFFILDISKPEFTGWGDYVRWVGAAAASVVVWEWVERIEALEREEKKDGILGREVFDGDEMMDANPNDFAWPRRRRTTRKDDDESGNASNNNSSSSGGMANMWPAMSSIANRYRSRSGSSPTRQQESKNSKGSSTAKSTGRLLQPPLWPSRPPPAVTPISRTDTASADSTVYAVRYQPLTETTSRTPAVREEEPESGRNSAESLRRPSAEIAERPTQQPGSRDASPRRVNDGEEDAEAGRWRNIGQYNPFRRGNRGPPAEVLPHTQTLTPQRKEYEGAKWDLRSRFEDFTATQAEKLRERMKPTPDTESLPVTVIPAPPRRGTALAQLLEDEELGRGQSQNPSSSAYANAPTPAQILRSNSHSSAQWSSPITPGGLTSGNSPLLPVGARKNSVTSVSTNHLNPLSRVDTSTLRTTPRPSTRAESRREAERGSDSTRAAERQAVDDVLGGNGTNPSPPRS